MEETLERRIRTMQASVKANARALLDVYLLYVRPEVLSQIAAGLSDIAMDAINRCLGGKGSYQMLGIPSGGVLDEPLNAYLKKKGHGIPGATHVMNTLMRQLSGDPLILANMTAGARQKGHMSDRPQISQMYLTVGAAFYAVKTYGVQRPGIAEKGMQCLQTLLNDPDVKEPVERFYKSLNI